MTLTLGAHHHATGPALFTISTPIGLVVTLSTIPNYVPADVYNPTEYHGLGRLNVGNSLGYLPHVSLVTPLQLVYPLPDELTLLRVGPVQGLTVDIDEIVRPAVLTSSKMPWDRTPTLIVLGANVASSPGGSVVTHWTYTVPTGKKLLITKAKVAAVRWTAATTLSYFASNIAVGGAQIAFAFGISNVIGTEIHDDQEGGTLTLQAGSVLTGQSQDTSTGGSYNVSHIVNGTLFDA